MCTYVARMRHKTLTLAEISEVKRPVGPSTQFLLIFASVTETYLVCDV